MKTLFFPAKVVRDNELPSPSKVLCDVFLPDKKGFWGRFKVNLDGAKEMWIKAI